MRLLLQSAAVGGEVEASGLEAADQRRQRQHPPDLIATGRERQQPDGWLGSRLEWHDAKAGVRVVQHAAEHRRHPPHLRQ